MMMRISIEELRRTLDSHVANARLRGHEPTRDEVWAWADGYGYPKPPTAGLHRPVVEHLISAVLERTRS
jgi:hypothetical protein